MGAGITLGLLPQCELVQLKLNIETSDGDSNPSEAKMVKLHLVEDGVLKFEPSL